MHPGPPPGLLGTVYNLAGERVQTTHGSLCQMQQGGLAHVTEHVHGTFFTFPKDQGGLQIKMPRTIKCSAAWGHLTQCCQLDDGTRQLAEITYKDALEKHGYLDMEDLQFEVEFWTWDQASQNSFTFACHLTSTTEIQVSWDPFNPDWIASAANANLTQVMIKHQHPIHIQLKNEQKWAKVVEVKDEERLVTMRTDTRDTFMMKKEGQDTTTGYPALREAIQRTSPTLV